MKRRRNLGHVTDTEVYRLQNKIDSMTVSEMNAKKKGNLRLKRLAQERIKGAVTAAGSLGVLCECFEVLPRPRKYRRRCVCARSKAGLKKKREQTRTSYMRHRL